MSSSSAAATSATSSASAAVPRASSVSLPSVLRFYCLDFGRRLTRIPHSAGVDMPKEHLEPVMDGMRFASTMIVLNPRQSDQLQVPLGELASRLCFRNTLPLLTILPSPPKQPTSLPSASRCAGRLRCAAATWSARSSSPRSTTSRLRSVATSLTRTMSSRRGARSNSATSSRRPSSRSTSLVSEGAQSSGGSGRAWS